jgi:hypothetical protein
MAENPPPRSDAKPWKIIRVYEGQEVPAGVRILQQLSREDEPIPGTTNNRRVYTLAVIDEGLSNG